MSAVYEELLKAQQNGRACALVTVTKTKGSIPRHAGAKMIVYDAEHFSGTIGGGKFEALVIDDAVACLASNEALSKSYPLHEKHADSFGAICGGEVSVFIEPHLPNARMVIIGGGHCAQAIAQAAQPLGMEVFIIEDRDHLSNVSHARYLEAVDGVDWRPSDLAIIVSRNHQIDTDALERIVGHELTYIGMIGSKKKVRTVFETLKTRGIPPEQLDRVYAPIGLDIGADSPAEIALSVLAEVLKVRNGASGAHLRIG